MSNLGPSVRPVGMVGIFRPYAPDQQFLLVGYMIDADYVLAALLRQLDTDRSADTLASFLDFWHNGIETFYQARDTVLEKVQSGGRSNDRCARGVRLGIGS